MDRVFFLIGENPGLTDREITDRLLGKMARPQSVNQASHSLVSKGLVRRCRRPDGKFGSYAVGTLAEPPSGIGGEEFFPDVKIAVANMSEDEVKRNVRKWLEKDGWIVTVEERTARGPDIEAKRGKDRWVIEAKGSGSRNPTRKNYFLVALGEALLRMENPELLYSIALPEMREFRRLWMKLPEFAKSRLGITALFVRADGHVDQVC